ESERFQTCVRGRLPGRFRHVFRILFMPHLLPTSSFTATGSHLRVDGISFSYPDRRVLTDVSFVVSAGDRVGLIGENGSGQSTLIRVIAGVLEAAGGGGTVT